MRSIIRTLWEDRRTNSKNSKDPAENDLAKTQYFVKQFLPKAVFTKKNFEIKHRKLNEIALKGAMSSVPLMVLAHL